VEGTAWHAVFAAARTPPEAVARLNRAIVAALNDPGVQERMRAAGTVPVGSTPAELAAFQRAELAKWLEIARAVGAKAE
jgi:tripartite-type tricarboxylate transporter receptor subunit TctC